MTGQEPRLGPGARAVYAALAEPGTEAEVVQRTGMNPKSVGARIGQDLIPNGLVESIRKVEGPSGRLVNIYAQVPEDGVAEARARHEGPRVKRPRSHDIATRKRIVRELLKDGDLLEALAADRAADRATARARKAAREELRERERRAADLRRHERRAAEAEDPLLPLWRAFRTFTQGADAARILAMMLERDRELLRVRGEPLVEFGHWSDGLRHTTDMLEVAGRLHVALHELFGVERTDCPACGTAIDNSDNNQEVIDAEIVDEYAELVSGTD